MRRLVIFLLLVLVAGAISFQLFEKNNGFVLISVGTTSITLNVWFALFLFVATFLGLCLSVWLLRSSGEFFSAGIGRLFYRHERRNRLITARGLVDYIEGNWKSGRRLLLRSATKSETPLINYLAAARCSFELGDEKEAAELLHKAEQSTPKSTLAILLTQARLQFINRKFEQAAATLQRAQVLSPKHPVVLDLLAKVYEGLNDWDSVKKILPNLTRYRILKPEQLTKLTLTMNQQLIRQTGDQAVKTGPEEGLKLLQKFWKHLTVQQQATPLLLTEYVAQLHRLPAPFETERVLRQSLNSHWSSEAIVLYGQFAGADVGKQLLRAEQWLTERPGSAELLLTLGRLSLRNKLWGKARDYFESSLARQSAGETYAELARLLASLGELEKSTEYYQQGLLLMTSALPDLPLPVRKMDS